MRALPWTGKQILVSNAALAQYAALPHSPTPPLTTPDHPLTTPLPPPYHPLITPSPPQVLVLPLPLGCVPNLQVTLYDI